MFNPGRAEEPLRKEVKSKMVHNLVRNRFLQIGCEWCAFQKIVWFNRIHVLWLRERRAGKTFQLVLNGSIKWVAVRTSVGDFVVELYV